MKASRVFVTVVVMLAVVCMATPVRAQVNTNFVKKFMDRYRPATVKFPAAPTGTQSAAIPELVRNGQLPLTMGDLINLILQNNLDLSVNRLSPMSSQYVIDSLYRTFEPNLHVQATINRNTSPATTILSGAANPSSLGGAYTVCSVLSRFGVVSDFSTSTSNRARVSCTAPLNGASR